MKRRYYSTIEKKPSIIIHRSIRSSNSLQIKSNTSSIRRQNLSSVSVTRHSRYLSENVTIVSTNEKDIQQKQTSSSISRSNPIQPSKSALQLDSARSKNIIKNSQQQQQSINFSNSNQAIVDNGIENHNNNFNNLKTDSIKSIKTDRAKNNTFINDRNGVKTIDTQLNQKNDINRSEKKSKRKHKRRCFAHKCCSCSRLCAITSVFTALLLGTIIGVITVAVLSKTKSTTLTSTITTETTTTTTTTTSTTITTTTTTTSITTATTSTTQTTTVVILSIGANDTLQGIWNTIVGGSSTLATPGTGAGNYVPAEGPPNAFDNNCATKYTSFGSCALNPALNSPICALNTGFYVTLHGSPVVMKSLRYCTGNDFPERDPITMTLEGSNQTGSTLMLGSGWTLIYNGSCGLNVDPGRNSLGQIISFAYNSIAYVSYRILITSKRASDFAVQYGEMNLFVS